MKYRLALDLGTNSIGWALLRLSPEGDAIAIAKAGARIFSDGRDSKGESLAVTRRNARSLRRRRDRLLQRKTRMLQLLTAHGFFPVNEEERRALVDLNPFEIRARGLNEKLTPAEFARALFHINQRRGFKSNRKTDKKENDSGALKIAIKSFRNQLSQVEGDGHPRTAGEMLYRRMTDETLEPSQRTVRARFRQLRSQNAEGKARIEKSYDLYIDRKMIEDEFDALWSIQTGFDPLVFNEKARAELKDCLLFQRKLRAGKPGRCTLIPEEERALMALPSTQLFRIYQELNNIKLLAPDLSEINLSVEQRDEIAAILVKRQKLTFTQIKKQLNLSGSIKFNLEDERRQELKGNATTSVLASDNRFGEAWHSYPLQRQDEIVKKITTEQSEADLIKWLILETGVREQQAENIANATLPEGYGSLSEKALALINPQLVKQVVTYSAAVIAAGFKHHSRLDASANGEILDALPYYGEALTRHVAFGSGKPNDAPEKRFGKIANPTVHIGLNQVRLLVNALITRYGHPSQVVIEVARDLKQSREQKAETARRQTDNQKRNSRIRTDVALMLGIDEIRVRQSDIQKWILWEELSFDTAERRCPYSGVQISPTKLLSDEVEIEHILPFAQTLDDSLNNKTVAMRQANRIKKNQTPWQAFGAKPVAGFDYKAIIGRAEGMPKEKRYRFAEDGMQRWLRDDKDFLARALNDTSYLCRIAREYVSLICPQDTRVIPGRLTGILRAKLGLNDILGLRGEKNREDHRHHAVDACVIGITDRSMLQKFAAANASTRNREIDRLVEEMPLPWTSYQMDAKRAVNNIYVSHKPDHGHEGALHNDTAYSLLGDGMVGHTKEIDGERVFHKEKLTVLEFSDAKASRHGSLPNGEPKPYKGYKADGNYCIEITKNSKGKWEGEVLSTFEANRIVGELGQFAGVKRLRHPTLSQSNKPLVMRLLINDTVRLKVEGRQVLAKVTSISSNGQIFLAEHFEANTDARNRDKGNAFKYISKTAGSLQKAEGKRVSISPLGVVKDSFFSG
jgi:CRISPR-associated endonuclease Csn1